MNSPLALVLILVLVLSQATISRGAEECHSSPKVPPSMKNSSLSLASRDAIQWAAGVYLDERRIRYNRSRRLVLLTSGNFGYLSMLLVWMCRMRELGLKFVVHAQDKQLYEYLLAESNRGGPFGGGFSTFYEPHLAGHQDFAEFGGSTYVHTCCLKPRALMAVFDNFKLAANASDDRVSEFDVWFSDPDIAFFKDPTRWFIYGAKCDMQYQINDQNRRPEAEAVKELLAGGAFNAEFGGNSGFALWRGTEAGVAVARAVAEECLQASYAPFECHKYSGDQAVIWAGILNDGITQKKATTSLGVRLPKLATRFWPNSANWQHANPLTLDSKSPPPIGGSGKHVFDYCPLPLLTHAVGSYWKSAAWAVASSRTHGEAETLIAHANFIKGSHLKMKALRSTKATWALRTDDVKKVTELLSQGAVHWPFETCRNFPAGAAGAGAVHPPGIPVHSERRTP
jgi:hypothetical protein